MASEKVREFKELKCHYQTHSTIGRRKKDLISTFHYATDLGLIEKSEWEKRVNELIEKYDEVETLESLKRFLKNECAWLNYERFKPSMEDQEERMKLYEENIKSEALELHAMRIFECYDWKGLEVFENVYANKGIKQMTLA